VKELAIASNMIVMARNAKTLKQKRSLMLQMVMPLFSKASADKLADCIETHNSREFSTLWQSLKPEIAATLEKKRDKPDWIPNEKNMALASMGDITRSEWNAMHNISTEESKPAEMKETYADVTTFQRDGDTAVCIQTYGPRKIRISVNGKTVMEGVPEEGTFVPANPIEMSEQPNPDPGFDPASHVEECGVVEEPQATVQISTGQTGENYVLTGEQMVKVVKLVCERLLMDADPCPLPPRMMAMPTNCAEHDWPDCKVCLHGLKGFDFSANILELYDKLTASSI
jgi:hypothetical protein